MNPAGRPGDDCPYCGAVNDAATGLTGARVPSPGDVGVCFSCAGLLIFQEVGVRVPTDLERSELLSDPGVVRAVGAVLELVAQRT